MRPEYQRRHQGSNKIKATEGTSPAPRHPDMMGQATKSETPALQRRSLLVKRRKERPPVAARIITDDLVYCQAPSMLLRREGADNGSISGAFGSQHVPGMARGGKQTSDLARDEPATVFPGGACFGWDRGNGSRRDLTGACAGLHSRPATPRESFCTRLQRMA